jgi:hypothetical protein
MEHPEGFSVFVQGAAKLLPLISKAAQNKKHWANLKIFLI